MRNFWLICLLILLTNTVNAQTARKLLPRVINTPYKQAVAPVLSGDGKTLIFMSNYSPSGKMELKISYLQGTDSWTEPVLMGDFNHVTLDHVGGFSLSYDGQEFYFSSRRSPGIGSFDIFRVAKKGNGWSTPENLGKPVNSEGNDGYPFLAPDNRTLYFARCQKMDLFTCSDCKILKTERKGKVWTAPEELPVVVNSGDACCPVVMMDNQTFVFAAKRNGQDHYDFYQSRISGNTFSQPVSMDFLNTELDDRFVSFPATGRLAYFSTKFRDQYSLIQADVPVEHQPSKILVLSGKVLNQHNEPVDAVVQYFDREEGKTTNYVRTKNGNYFISGRFSGELEVAVIPIEGNLLFDSRLYLGNKYQQSEYEEIQIVLRDLQDNMELKTNLINFYANSATLDVASGEEIRRLAKLIRDHNYRKVEISVYQDKVICDSIPGPGLTEIKSDTILVQGLSSAQEIIPDSIPVIDLESDSTGAYFSTFVDYLMETASAPSFRVKNIYHNNRTGKQAEAIRQALHEAGLTGVHFVTNGLGDKHDFDVRNFRQGLLISINLKK
jgi:Tol biopolymer transport system component